MIEFSSLHLTAPDASIIGVIEEGKGRDWPEAAMLPDGLGEFPDSRDLVLLHPFSKLDALARSRAISRLLEMRRAGATLVLITHDEAFLERCADEIWWLRNGEFVARGDPSEILPLYRGHVARTLRSAGAGQIAPLTPVSRDGDGRAAIHSIELLGEHSEPATVWRSGEPVGIRVSVRYSSDVAEPVVGILIRTRIGLNVYGTNTELENLHPGPLRAGETLRVIWRFRCDLCPGDYTVTAASHDPDGVWHDWQEDAVAFTVSDARYTAGVANLRAQVYAEVLANVPAADGAGL